jgi:poly-gamma-glutamate synthesis protein (capsule biosynthesis protein)
MKKSKRFTIDERVLKWSKLHKRYNLLFTLLVLIAAIVLLVLILRLQKSVPVEAMPKQNNEINLTYLGNINMNSNIRKNDLNETFGAVKDILKGSDYSTASLHLSKFADNPKMNRKENIDNILYLKELNLKSLNLINNSVDNIQARDLQKDVEAQLGYNFLTGNGSNPINSKTVQQNVKGQKIASVDFTDVDSDYSDPLKNTTSISLKPKIFMPLLKKLKEDNDMVVVNVDWGIPDEKHVTARQQKYAHALSDAGADIIIGHNTVIQKVEKYKHTNIFYSLGNVTSENFLSKNQQGITVQQKWDGKKSNFLVTPIKSQGGKVTRAQPSKVEEIKLLNNLNSDSVKLKKVKGGYHYES